MSPDRAALRRRRRAADGPMRVGPRHWLQERNVELEGRVRVIWHDQRRWTVREVEQGTWSEADHRSLIYESEGIARRVREYPVGWFTLSDEDLYGLSLGKLAP